MSPNNGEPIAAPFPAPVKSWHNNTYPSLSPSRPELSAKGKNIIITGGGTGIGAGTAHAFAQAGASRIGLLGRREQPLLDTKASIEAKFPGVKVFTASTVITKEAEVNAAFEKFAGDEKIDVLISNAAVAGPMESITAVDGNAFLAGIQTNISGALWLAKAFGKHAASDAVVVDINSMAGHLDVADGIGSYSVSKIGVARLWDNFSFARPDMRIYHIQPGVVDTDMNRAAGGVKAEFTVNLPSTFNVWLASPEAKFLKGRFLYANWNVDELKAQAAEIEGTDKFRIGLNGWPFGVTNQHSWAW